MLPIERKDIIRDMVYEKKTVSVLELSEYFGVSPETIRRDINARDSEGILTKTYGGAKFKTQVSKKIPTKSLLHIMPQRKNAMAYEASKYIQQNDCIFMGYSTTVLALCSHIPDMPLTVVTNSLPVIQFFADYKSVRLENVGGTYISSYDAFSSFHAIESLDRYSFDKALLSCQAVDFGRGMCDQNDMICGLQQKVLEVSNQVYLIADNSKINQRAFLSYGDLSRISELITDAVPPVDVQQQLLSLKIPYTVANIPSQEAAEMKYEEKSQETVPEEAPSIEQEADH